MDARIPFFDSGRDYSEATLFSERQLKEAAKRAMRYEPWARGLDTVDDALLYEVLWEVLAPETHAKPGIGVKSQRTLARSHTGALCHVTLEAEAARFPGYFARRQGESCPSFADDLQPTAPRAVEGLG